ncbi:MAG: tol-pal system protein YbgF [Nitrospinota bacterium]
MNRISISNLILSVVISFTILALFLFDVESSYATVASRLDRIDKKLAQLEIATKNQADFFANLAELQRLSLSSLTKIDEFNTRSDLLYQKLINIEQYYLNLKAYYKARSLEESSEFKLNLKRINNKIDDLLIETLAYLELTAKSQKLSKKEHKQLVASIKERLVRNNQVFDNENSHVGTLSEADQLYSDGYALFLNKEYSAAIDSFNQFVENYPDNVLTPNATFWIGESYLLDAALEPAVTAFDHMATKYQDSPKALQALLKAGEIYQKLGKDNKAIVRYKQILSLYPDAKDNDLAKRRLKKLGVSDSEISKELDFDDDTAPQENSDPQNLGQLVE